MMNITYRSLLDDSKNISIITSNKSVVHKNLLSSTVNDYNVQSGYTTINNPGWIILKLNKPCEISYLRFLLWDNCGAKKTQPSNRKYLYRLLIADYNNDNVLTWNAIYENTLNPSNGWQEFYFEDKPRNIIAIKIQFFQNTTTSSNHKGITQLVSIQAYREPTKAIKELISGHNNEIANTPIPNLGHIRNRVIIGDEQALINIVIEDEIHRRIISYIRSIKNCSTIDNNTKDKLKVFEEEIGNHSNNDVTKQINIFHTSILRPINNYRDKIKHKYLWLTIISWAIFMYETLKNINDILHFI